MDYKGFYIVESARHGKACKGLKKTSSIQIRNSYDLDGSYILMKQIRFIIGDQKSKERAIVKAKEFIDKLIKEK